MSDLSVSSRHESIEKPRCLHCQQQLIVLVDVETETAPRTDRHGHWLYYCLTCHRTFATHITVCSQPRTRTCTYVKK